MLYCCTQTPQKKQWPTQVNGEPRPPLLSGPSIPAWGGVRRGRVKSLDFYPCQPAMRPPFPGSFEVMWEACTSYTPDRNKGCVVGGLVETQDFCCRSEEYRGPGGSMEAMWGQCGDSSEAFLLLPVRVMSAEV